MRWAAFPHQSENFKIGSLVHAERRGPMAAILCVALGLMPSATTRQISSRPVRLAIMPLFHRQDSLPPLPAATLSASSKQGRALPAQMIAEVAAEAPAWYAADLFVDPRVEGILSFPLVAKDLVLLYMYGHVPIVMYLLWYQAKNGSLQNAWQFGSNAPRAAAGMPSSKPSASRRSRSLRMMAKPKKEKPNQVSPGTPGFVSEQGSASYYFTWTVALGIYALMFAGIAKHAAGN